MIVNPKATTTSERARDVLVRALRSAADLDVAHTTRRGHASELAAKAAADGVEAVVTLGGDGTVNETVNGLLSGGRTARTAPALGVVPGGSTNVFARAVGMPSDWIDGAGVILEALRDKSTRTVGLGKANGRYFTFCAGVGLDAAVIRRVERARMRGQTATPSRYVRETVTQFLPGGDRRHPQLALSVPGEKPVQGLALAIVQNTSPWTYLGGRSVDPNPRASFDTGLDVFALRTLSIPVAARTLGQLFSGRKLPHGRQVVTYHDMETFRLSTQLPQAFQLDGDYLGECDELELVSVPEALRVLC